MPRFLRSTTIPQQHERLLRRQRRSGGSNTCQHTASTTSIAASTHAGRSYKFNGVYPIVVTPFHADRGESLDLDSFQRSIRFLASEIRVAGITVTGVLGESNRLTDDERQRLIETARMAATRGTADRPVHLCVGSSHTGTAATVALCQMAQELGADSVMVAPLSSHGIEDLYHRIAAVCPNLPIVVQDHPSLTGVQMSTDLLVRLATQVPTVSCIKLESLPTVDRLVSLRAHPDWKDDSCAIVTGLGALYAGFDVEHHTDGFMTGLAFPEVLQALHATTAGDKVRLHAIYNRFLPLIVLEQYGGLALRKEIYRMRELIENAHVRHPGTNLSTTLQNTLRLTLDRVLPGVDLTKPLEVDDFISTLP